MPTQGKEEATSSTRLPNASAPCIHPAFGKVDSLQDEAEQHPTSISTSCYHEASRTNMRLFQVPRSMLPSLFVLAVFICIFQFCLAEIDIALPKELLNDLPGCALECVKNFVAQELASLCDDTTDLHCLCETLTANTYTLGEGALTCIVEECPSGPYMTQELEKYNVCTQDPNAIPPAHTMLPASDILPPTLSSYSNVPSTIQASRVSGSTSLRASKPSSTQASLVQPTTMSTSVMAASSAQSSSLPLSSATAMSTYSSSSLSAITLSTDPTIPPIRPSIAPDPSGSSTGSSAASATSSSTAGPAAVLGTGQIAGIAVAGTVTAATALGLVFYIFCGKRLKKQKKRRDSDASFGGSHIYPSDPEPRPGGEHMVEAPKPATPLIPLGHRSFRGGPKQNEILGLPYAPNQHRHSWWKRKAENRVNLKPETPTQIGVAKHLTPRAGGVSQDNSPGSDISYKTTSQLLPEKPSYYPADRTLHEKKASNDTASSQPTRLGGGPGLRVIAPTPEPADSRSSGSYRLYDWPARVQNHLGLKKEPSMEGSALKGKLSDPFLNKPHEQIDPAHPSNAMFKNASRAPKPSLPKLDTVPMKDASGNLPHQRLTHTKGVPNFRHLVQPQARTQLIPPQRSPPPQLPNVAPFSPISPEISKSLPTIVAHHPPGGSSNSRPIMDRGRPAQNPFFSSQQSQHLSFKPPRVRSRRIRPETHYTTSSDTSFEDEGPSPLSPPEPPPHMHIAELPGLSPVAESPISRATRENTATRTPSPRIQPTPPSNEARGTPLSRLRYPEIPGKSESPRREVGTVPLAIEYPREAKVLHVSQLQKPVISPLSQTESPLQRQDSTGSTVFSPGAESPAKPPGGPMPSLLSSPQQKPKLVPSPLRPARGRDSLRNQEEEPRPPPPPPKDDPQRSYPSPATTAFSTQMFHQAARRLGSIDTTSAGLGNWPVQPTRPVELPARNSGLGNWPVQPTLPARQIAPPRPQFEGQPGPHIHAYDQQLPTPDGTFASNTLRVVPPENPGRVVAPGSLADMYHTAHAQNLSRSELPTRQAAPLGRLSGEQTQPSDARTRPFEGQQVVMPPRDPRREMQRLRDLERRREFERQYERQQLEASRQLSDYDVSRSTAPLLPPKGSFNQVQARRELLAGGFDLQNPRGF